MTQLDSESLNSTNSLGNNDRKIVCETLAIAGAGVPPEELPPDFPPESFCLSKEAELDWFDRNAFLERKESGKGNSSHSMNVSSNLNSSSQRVPLTLKTKTTFFGLPKSSSSVDPKRKTCKPVNIRFFPTKRSESALKAVAEPEPVSPKVSCMGRVRSKKGRKGSASCEPGSTKCEISTLQRSKSSKAPPVKRKIRIYSRVLSLLGFSRRNIKPVMASTEKMHDFVPEEEPVQHRKSNALCDEPVQRRKSNALRIAVSDEPGTGPTGLGGMMRFTSGRRSESWAAEEIDTVLSELGSDRKVVGVH
ncbi:hypothetical protein FXO38_15372 [Capsicum annuum]|uniref:uncharacterized protein LOC107845114 n=1 Tax=Capsicum annuum TaxID=4072 RepID=UPI001FB19777|nr:uncharacterized protein LOC107845114 [Capsicum annuum]KAF3645276.1 hypothetical protein FXO37_21064 [Capsicum annuum]KAF3653997.1 hypothetical protein FXO38_15372 [Capsicum annuum]